MVNLLFFNFIPKLYIKLHLSIIRWKAGSERAKTKLPLEYYETKRGILLPRRHLLIFFFFYKFKRDFHFLSSCGSKSFPLWFWVDLSSVLVPSVTGWGAFLFFASLFQPWYITVKVLVPMLWNYWENSKEHIGE